MSQTKAQLIDPVDGTIVNADINASAAIAGSKISPSFTANTTITAASPVLRLADSTDPQGTDGIIGKIEFFGNDGSSGGVDVRSFVQTISTNAAGNAHALTIGLGESNNAPTEKIRILGDGKVGIGTTSPGGKLSVFDSSSAVFRLETPGVIAISHTFDGTDYTIANNDGSSGHSIIFGSKTSGAESMRIDSSGRLLLGTTTEGYTTADDFTIAGSGDCGMTIRSGTSSQSAIAFSDATSGNAEFAGQISYYHSSDELVLTANASQIVKIHDEHFNILAAEGTLRMNFGFQNGLGGELSIYDQSGSQKTRITGSANTNHFFNNGGNVGIGLSNPDTLLHLAGGSPNIKLHNTGSSASANDIFGAISFQHSDSDDAGITAIIQCIAEDNAGNSFLAFHNGDGGNADERMRIDSSGRVLIGTTISVGTNTPNLQVKAASPGSGFDNHIYLEGSETSGAVNTGATIGFGGHDGTTARNWAQIAGFKSNGTSGNTSSFLSFRTRRSGVSGINEMWKITAMGSFLARDSKESAIGREYTSGSVAAGATVNYDGGGGATANSRLNFNSIGGNGGGHITCLSISSFDQNPSGALIVAGVHGQGFNSYDTILNNFDSGISVTFSGTVTIQNTSSETIYYSVNVIHMGTGNTTYLGR